MNGSSGRQRVQTDVVKEHVFDAPALAEQNAIASVLSSLDDKIDLLHRQNQTLEQMAETLFRQWFVEEADEGWEIKKLKELVDIRIGRTPPRKEFHWFSKSIKDIKWVSIKDLGDSGVFVLDTSEYLTEEAVEKFNIPIIPPDTVLLSFKMTLGRVAITTEHMLSNEAIAHFKFNDETPFTKEFLYFYLKTYPYETLGSTSSIVTSINSGMIKDMEAIIPDDATLTKFENQVIDYFDKIKSNQTQIHTLTALRDTLLPKLMSGEVRVSV
jgi:type I restriction enzyme S subunit